MPARRTRPPRKTPDRSKLDRMREGHPLLMAFVDALDAAPTIPIESMRLLDIPDVNLKAGTAEILCRTRNGELTRRAETIGEGFANILGDSIGDRVSGPIFLSPFGNRFSSGSLWNLWRRACREVGLNGSVSIRDAIGRRPFRGKTNSESYTKAEIAENLQGKVERPRELANQVCHSKGFGHRCLGSRIGKKRVGNKWRAVYPHLRQDGTCLTPYGRVEPTYCKEDCEKLFAWYGVSDPPEGYVWADEVTAEDLTVKFGEQVIVENLHRLESHRVIDFTHSDRRVRGGRKGKTWVKRDSLCLHKKQLYAHYKRRLNARRRKQGHLLYSELSTLVGRKESFALHMIANDFCSDLNRPLNLWRKNDNGELRFSSQTGDGAPVQMEILRPHDRRAHLALERFAVAYLLLPDRFQPYMSFALAVTEKARIHERFDNCYLIDEREADLINAVNAVWIDLSTIRAKLELGKEFLPHSVRAGRIACIDLLLTHKNCRRFRRPGVPGSRLHASAVIALARHHGFNEWADELQQALDEYGKLAEKALDHWQPDPDPAATDLEQAAADQQPADTTPEQDGSRDGSGKPKSTGGGRRRAEITVINGYEMTVRRLQIVRFVHWEFDGLPERPKQKDVAKELFGAKNGKLPGNARPDVAYLVKEKLLLSEGERRAFSGYWLSDAAAKILESEIAQKLLES